MEFRLIPGFEPFEISSSGILRRGNKILTSEIGKNGYKRKFLKGINKNVLIHRMVALTFIPNPNNYPDINHKDCDKLNNDVSNLEWVTRSQNTTHAMINGKLLLPTLKAEKCPNAVLKNKDVLLIRKLIQQGCKNKDLAVRFNVDQSTISNIKTRKNWKSI